MYFTSNCAVSSSLSCSSCSTEFIFILSSILSNHMQMVFSFYSFISYSRLNFSSVSCMLYISAFSALLFYFFPSPIGHQKTSSWRSSIPHSILHLPSQIHILLRMSHDSPWLTIYTGPQLLFLPSWRLGGFSWLADVFFPSTVSAVWDQLRCMLVQTLFLLSWQTLFSCVIKCCLVFPWLLAVDGWIFFFLLPICGVYCFYFLY